MMVRTFCRLVGLFGALLSGVPIGTAAVAQERTPRLGLVIGEADYRAGALSTPANDAGVIAQSLAAAGFDVTGYANLEGVALRRAFADFLIKAKQAGPEAVVFVYLAGYGLQFSGDNYIVPIEARIARDVDVPMEAVSLAAFSRDLEAAPLKARILVTDLARSHPFARSGTPLAGGLALIEPAPGSLSAANTAPGAEAEPERGLYGLYAQALSEMMQVKGLPIEDLLSRVRARVNALSDGAAVPWNDGTLDKPFALFPPVPDLSSSSSLALKPVSALSAEDAYWAAILRDTLEAYVAVLKSYPDDPLASRVRPLLAVRREALTFSKAVVANTPNAYWTYMRRYPRGPHFPDVRRRLAVLAAPLEPPPRFDSVAFPDLPSPAPDERDLLDRSFGLPDEPDDEPVRAPSSAVVPERRIGFYDRPPPLLAIAADALPLPLPMALGFASERGRIVQPALGSTDGPVTATATFDPAGNPVVSQTGPHGEILSTASVAIGSDGVRTIKQTGPGNRTVSTMVETIGANGNRTVVQTDEAKHAITTMSIIIEPSGNRVVTLFGPNTQLLSILKTTPNGMILAQKDGSTLALPVRPVARRPVVLQARTAAPAIGDRPSGAASVHPSDAASVAVGATPAAALSSPTIVGPGTPIPPRAIDANPANVGAADPKAALVPLRSPAAPVSAPAQAAIDLKPTALPAVPALVGPSVTLPAVPRRDADGAGAGVLKTGEVAKETEPGTADSSPPHDEVATPPSWASSAATKTTRDATNTRNKPRLAKQPVPSRPVKKVRGKTGSATPHHAPSRQRAGPKQAPGGHHAGKGSKRR